MKRKYCLFLPYGCLEVKPGIVIRIDLYDLNMELKSVPELQGCNYSVVDGHRESGRIVNYVKIASKGEIKKKLLKKRASAKLIFSKFEKSNLFDEVEDRYLAFDVIVNSESLNASDSIMDEIQSLFKTKMDICFARCPYDDGSSFGDSALIPFEYGSMKELKSEIMSLFKEIKQELNLR